MDVSGKYKWVYTQKHTTMPECTHYQTCTHTHTLSHSQEMPKTHTYTHNQNSYTAFHVPPSPPPQPSRTERPSAGLGREQAGLHNGLWIAKLSEQWISWLLASGLMVCWLLQLGFLRGGITPSAPEWRDVYMFVFFFFLILHPLLLFSHLLLHLLCSLYLCAQANPILIPCPLFCVTKTLCGCLPAALMRNGAFI